VGEEGIKKGNWGDHLRKDERVTIKKSHATRRGSIEAGQPCVTVGGKKKHGTGRVEGSSVGVRN